MPEKTWTKNSDWKKRDEIRNYLIEEINRNELKSKKHKKVCRVLSYFDNSLIVISTITGYVSISAFSSLVGIPIWDTCSAVGLKICLTTAGIKKYKSINKKNKKKHDKIVLWAKSKLNSVEDLISKKLIDSNINHDEFGLINNVLKEFYNTKEEIKNSNKQKFNLYVKQCYLIV